MSEQTNKTGISQSSKIPVDQLMLDEEGKLPLHVREVAGKKNMFLFMDFSVMTKDMQT